MVTIPFEYRQLPTAEDLPDSDETPVDNELQNDIPNILLNLLRLIWSDRQDWFFGVDMCCYYEANLEEPKKSRAIVPDGFLAIGVPRLEAVSGVCVAIGSVSGYVGTIAIVSDMPRLKNALNRLRRSLINKV
jgi:Uma2 family endonuclease